jgi:hypothetical protein
MTSKILLLALAAVAVVLASPALARADVVTDWNNYASTAITAPPPMGAGQPPHVAPLSFAMVQGAVYDAVNAIDRGHRPYLVMPSANPWDSKEAAAATAAFEVLRGLFPAQLPTLQPLYDASLAAVPDGPMKDGGIAAGDAAAQAMLAAREDDGRGSPFTIPIGTTPGAWRPVPPVNGLDPAPWVGNVKPFLVPDVSMLRTKGPNRLTSRAYARDVNEVKQVGSLTSTTRTADQTDAALWWQDHGAALWNRIFQTLSASQGLDTVANARLFAMENLAAADAAIGCWNDKYYWNFWRPITAIREAATDGNRATEADPTWLPLFDPSTPSTGAPLVTPPFPDHPSGHSCVSSAIVHTLQSFFGTDKVAFSALSNRTGTTRSFDSFSDALDEVIDARVWAGIHFRTADNQGASLGKKVARWEKRHYFQSLRRDDYLPRQ